MTTALKSALIKHFKPFLIKRAYKASTDEGLSEVVPEVPQEGLPEETVLNSESLPTGLEFSGSETPPEGGFLNLFNLLKKRKTKPSKNNVTKNYQRALKAKKKSQVGKGAMLDTEAA